LDFAQQLKQIGKEREQGKEEESEKSAQESAPNKNKIRAEDVERKWRSRDNRKGELPRVIHRCFLLLICCITRPSCYCCYT